MKVGGKDINVDNVQIISGASMGLVAPRLNTPKPPPFYHSGVTVKNCFFDGNPACSFDHVDNITFTENKTSHSKLLVHLDSCGKRQLDETAQIN